MKINSSFRVVFITLISIALALATLSTVFVHLYIERPRVRWKLETGTFTILLNAWAGQPGPEDDLPRPDEPNLEKLCRGIIGTMMPRKCPETKVFNIWCRNGPWFPRGWPFISQDHGFLATLEEADCPIHKRLPTVELIVGQDGGSRFLLGGFLANWACFFLASLMMSTGIGMLVRGLLRRRMRRRPAFPVIELPV